MHVIQEKYTQPAFKNELDELDEIGGDQMLPTNQQQAEIKKQKIKIVKRITGPPQPQIETKAEAGFG